MITERNKNAVRKDVFKWFDQFRVMEPSFHGAVSHCEKLTSYIIDLCQKAYDKGVEETKNDDKK